MGRSRNSRIFDHLSVVWARVCRVAGNVNTGLDALHRVQFDEPWNRAHRPTYEEWQDYIAVRPTPRPRDAVAMSPCRTAHSAPQRRGAAATS